MDTQHGNLHPVRWPILFCGPTQEPVLATANTENTQQRFWEKCRWMDCGVWNILSIWHIRGPKAKTKVGLKGKCANIFTWRLLMIVLSIFVRHIELLLAQPCWFALYQWREENSRLLIWCTLLPHMQALFMTSETYSKWQCSWQCFGDSRTSILFNKLDHK